MRDPERLFTPAEAGVVSGMKLKAVHNAIDKRIVNPVTVGCVAAAGAAKRPAARRLTSEDLVRLYVWHRVGDVLSSDRRQRLFGEMAADPDADTIRADDLLTVHLGEARRRVDGGVRELTAAEAVVTKDSSTLGGQPVFKGTRIPVYGIVAMLEAGASVDQLLAGYPKLTSALLDLAKVWVSAHPRRGRPQPIDKTLLVAKGMKVVPPKRDPLAPVVDATR